MKKIFWILLFSSCLIYTYELKELLGFKNPRSIFANQEAVFVSNIGEKTNFLIKDKGGFISKLSKNGDIIDEKFIMGLDRPSSMFQIDYTLFVLDIDRLLAFDIRSTEQLFDLFINERSDLNRIVKLNDNTLLIGDNANSTLYKIDLQTRTYEEILSLDTNKFGNMSDFTFIKNKIYIIASNKDKNTLISVYDMSNKNIKLLKEEKANFNTIIAYENDVLLSDSSNGQLYRLNLSNKKGEALKIDKLNAITDMFLDNKILWLVELKQQKVLKILLKN